MTLTAVSQRADFLVERKETREGVDQNLIRFLEMVGCLPLSISNGLTEETLANILKKCNVGAIVLSGGNDVGSNEDRDRTERQLLDYAQSRKLPVLGICRGMQMMGVWAGAQLHDVSHHIRTTHCLDIDGGQEVNSFHAQSLVDCPPGFEVIARSEDGEIEAIQHRTLPWQGWMWHPERDVPFASRDVQRLKTLFGMT